MSRILVPIDFSPSSANALKYAYQISATTGMPLSLFHCFHPQHFNRVYDFKKQDYAVGIKRMLVDFYKKHASEKIGATHFLAQAGTIIEKVVALSPRYKLVVLGGRNFTSSFHKWLGSRASNIASLAKCPVMIITPTTTYHEWKNIWHINRKDNEMDIIEKGVKLLKIDTSSIQSKTFELSKPTSSFWEMVISPFIASQKPLNKDLINALATEKADVIILVSHQKDSFQKFVNSQEVQILFEHNIPILIFQE